MRNAAPKSSGCGACARLSALPGSPRPHRYAGRSSGRSTRSPSRCSAARTGTSRSASCSSPACPSASQHRARSAGLLGVGAVLQPGLERWLRPPWLRILSFPFLVWMGLFWLSFVALGFSDVVLGLMGASGGHDVAGARARRGRRPGAVGLAAGAAHGLRAAAAAARRDRARALAARARRLPHRPDQRHPHRPDARPPLRAQRLTERVNALAPDLVAVTGDLVDGTRARCATRSRRSRRCARATACSS